MAYDPDWDCYDIAVRQVGEESQIDITHSKNELANLTMSEVTKAILYNVERSHSNSFYRKTLYDDPWIEELGYEQTTNEGGETQYTFSGSLSESYVGQNNEILFMDLRHDILIMKTTETSMSFGDSSTAPIGLSTIDLGDRFSSQNIMDTVGVSAVHDTTVAVKERITVTIPAVDEVLYETTTTAEAPWKNVGISDYSGYIGALSWNGLVWGAYGYVDTPPGILINYGDPGGPSYENSYEGPSIVNDGYAYMYWPGWLPRGTIVTAEADVWASIFGANTTDSNTITYPISVRLFLKGSCAYSGNDALFVSLQKDNEEYWSYLATKTGEVTDAKVLLTENSIVPTTFYPIAPV